MSSKLSSLVGATNNLDEPTSAINEKSTVLALIILFQVLSWICALLRLYTRFYIVRSPGWDDIFTVLYLITTTSGSIIILPDCGMGQHFILLASSVVSEYAKRIYCARALYVMSTALIKISLLFQYLRIYRDRGLLRTACIVAIVLVSLWGVAFSFMAWFPCIPMKSYWDSTVPGTCYGFGASTVEEFAASFEAHAASNILFDFIVIVLPIPIYFQPETARRTRLGLLALFFMGSIVVAISIMRLHTLVKTRVATYPTFDPTWYGSLSIVLAALEVDSASICASLPVFWPTLRRHFISILVTNEVLIQHEHRMDETELGRASQSTFDSLPSREESDLELKTHMRTQHYNDSFIRVQIDPLSRKESNGLGTVSVQVQSTQVKQKRGFLFGRLL